MELNGSGGERIPVVIRGMSGRDLPGLLGMQQGEGRLDLPDSVVSGYTPLSGLIRGRWNPFRGTRIRTYIAAAKQSPVAFMQVRDRATDPRNKWDLIYLGAGRSAAAATPERRVELWAALLDYITAAAGRRGVQRLYAKVASDGAVAEAFHVAGYTRYGEETIHLLVGPPSGEPEGSEEFYIRPQAAGDTWALHQLYTLTAPKVVQYAEAYTSHRWELPRRSAVAAQGGLREWGFVVERGHEIAIYCRVARQGNKARLEFVYEPTARELLPQALGAILRWLDPGQGEQIYCATREFQAELSSILREHGFAAKEVQDVLVRYTVVSARAPALVPVGRLTRERRLIGVPAGSLRRQGHDLVGASPGEVLADQTEVGKLAEI
jgi:hypothetical protein